MTLSNPGGARKMLKRIATGSVPATTLIRLVREPSGNAAVMFSMSGFVLLASIGGAVDLARWFNLRNEMQSAIGAAALAGGRALQLSPTTDPSIVAAAATHHFENARPAAAIGIAP